MASANSKSGANGFLLDFLVDDVLPFFSKIRYVLAFLLSGLERLEVTNRSPEGSKTRQVLQRSLGRFFRAWRLWVAK